MSKRVVVTGSLAFDHIMGMPGKFADHIMADKVHILNVSFIMDRFRKEHGGTGGNIVYTLSLLGVECLLVSVAGNDFESYKKKLVSLNGVDVSGVKIFKDAVTAQGFVMTDRDDNQIWGFYEGAMGREEENGLERYIKDGDMLIVAPSHPKAMMNYVRLAAERRIPYMFDPAFNIAHFSAEDLAFAVENCEILVGNDYEIELIKRQLSWPHEGFYDPKRVVVTTLGGQGSEINRGKEGCRVGVVKVGKVVDPTGAGDGYRAGFMAGYVAGEPLKKCGQMGSLAAGYAVENYGTQNQKYSKSEFLARLSENFR